MLNRAKRNEASIGILRCTQNDKSYLIQQHPVGLNIAMKAVSGKALYKILERQGWELKRITVVIIFTYRKVLM
ncbi:hypothetical protein [Nostoc sp.]|uniref:hypothetical protein n=1 Tax=Nostoc sp. TaxID=1180 RepID=UPI002FF9337B